MDLTAAPPHTKNRTMGIARALLFAGFIAISGAGVRAEPKPAAAPAMPPFRLLYNSDGNHIFHGERRPEDPSKPWHERYMPPRAPISVEELLQSVDEVADSQVDTFLLCPVSNQVVTYRSAIEKRLGDGATDAQLATSSNNLRNTVQALRHFDALGIDPYQLLVQRIRDKKMRPMVTYRVQQAHVISGKEKSAAVSPFWQEHPEYRLRGNSGGEGNAALNFAIPAVRARKVALLRELVSKYGFDGCELDFQRFPLFFPRGKEAESIPFMNEFVRDVRAMLDEEGQKSGRKLALGVRVPETPARCRELGLDPAAWVNAGQLDFVVITKFLAQNPTDAFAIPHLTEDFEAFRQSFRQPVALLGSIQMCYAFKTPAPKSKTVQYQLTPEDYRREAAALWAKKLDGIELFNFFMARALYDARGVRSEPAFFLLQELGNPETIRKIHSPAETKWTRDYPPRPLPEPFRQALAAHSAPQ